ncbi:C50 carotenoid epsilon cyclase [Microbacterium mangrovi]|uniref:C50 carotenoid epsilon cyclase n=1 Tax=Microbacterium mangrovi TaxID=1348253 RepID=A0A0B2AAW8_9MICO|nr:lycopene cyclase domain-containing protein [Microbacterium mangrovi]KHK98722.1 C50 carotenoid epsilon cyclase [Microbacterium mangrovi]
MTSPVYLLCLVLAMGGMLLIDRRFRLFFWRDAAAAALVTAAGTGFLLLWDAAGIATGIFRHGSAAISTGILLAPALPLEEPVFLVFLVQTTMVLYTGADRLLAARERRMRERRGLPARERQVRR